MRGSLLLSTTLLLVACGGAPPVPEAPPAGSSAPAATAAPAATDAATPPAATPPAAATPGAAADVPAAGPGPAPAAAAVPAPALTRDPKITALARPALACKVEEGLFEEDCPAFKAWHDNEPLFEDGKGNDTILSMLGDADEKVRVLAQDKGIDNGQTYFADKARAARIFTLAAKERNPAVAHELGRLIAKIDAEKLGFGGDLRALAKHPVSSFRDALAFYLISTYQTPSALAALQTLLADPDPKVKKTAIGSLSTGGITPGVPPVCALLTKEIARTDDLAGDALWTGGSSKCPGMPAQVLTELEKRVTDPSKITNAVGIGYSLAVTSICHRSDSVDLKPRALAVGKKLADPKVPDPNTRRAAADIAKDCASK